MTTTQEIPQPKARLFLGHTLELTKDPCIFTVLWGLSRELGAIYRLNVAGKPWVVVSEKQYFVEVLQKKKQSFVKGSTLSELRAMARGLSAITDADGEAWQRWRTLLTPAFQGDALEAVVEIAQDKLEECARGLRAEPEFEAHAVMNQLALSVITKFAFDHDVESGERDGLLQRQDYFTEQLFLRMQRTPLWKYLPLPSNFRVKRCLRENEVFFRELIEARRSVEAPARRTVLDILLDEQKERGELSDAEIMVQLHGLMGAAFESTGSTLHWALYFLSQSPEVERALAAEVQGDSDSLLQNVVNETLRLRPAFPMLIREAASEETLGGYLVPKGAFVFCLIGAAHQNPEIWGPDAGEFRPERWDDLSPEQKRSFAPYGVGPRLCLGWLLAAIELPALLAGLLRRFRFELLPGQTSIKPQLKFAWVSEAGIRLRAVPRSEAS